MELPVSDGQADTTELAPGRRRKVTAQKPEYSGMTVNERLNAAGLMDEFDAALRARDRARIISVLERVALSHDDAAFSADTILGNPARYGG